MSWRYANEQGSAVWRFTADGGTESCATEVIADWIADGNTPEPWVPPSVEVPEAITMRQARIVLHRAGLLAGIDNIISSLPEPMKSEAIIAWEYSAEVHRHNGLVSSLAPALGLTEEQIDAMFLLGAGL